MFVNILIQTVSFNVPLKFIQTVGFNMPLKFNTGVPQNRSWNTMWQEHNMSDFVMDCDKDEFHYVAAELNWTLYFYCNT